MYVFLLLFLFLSLVLCPILFPVEEESLPRLLKVRYGVLAASCMTPAPETEEVGRG